MYSDNYFREVHLPGKLIFRIHAVRRMFERYIDEEDVRNVLENGEVIENYPDDMPFPSQLIMG